MSYLVQDPRRQTGQGMTDWEMELVGLQGLVRELVRRIEVLEQRERGNWLTYGYVGKGPA